MTNYEMVREFREVYGQGNDHAFSAELQNLNYDLMNEELTEVEIELFPFGEGAKVDKQKLAKELADLLYVTYGTAAAFGIPINDVYAEVHRSNMSKLGADGKPVYRDDGKVLKGPNYTPPDLSFVKECCNSLGNC